MAYEAYTFGSILDRKAVLEFNTMSQAIADLNTQGGITNFYLADSSVGRKNLIGGSVDGSILADGSVDFRHLKNESIGAAKYVPKSVGTGTLADNAVRSNKINNGAVEQRHLSFNDLDKNLGEVYPLINYTMSDGTVHAITDKIKNTILDVKIMNAQKDRIYQLDSVRYGLSDRYGLQVSSYNVSSAGRLYESGRKTEIVPGDGYQIYPSVDGKYETMVARNDNGLSVSVTYNLETIGTIVNIAENAQGGGRGAIIHPQNYSYGTGGLASDTLNSDNKVYVDKTSNEVKIYVPTISGYTGYSVKRRDVPFASGERSSNVDVWGIDRISGYERDGDTFTERPTRVFVYSADESNPLTTMDTIFRRVGDVDYSGGFYHGDEILTDFSIFVGNSHISELNGRYSGESVEIVQETYLYPDSYTDNTKHTNAFLKVNKVHRFNKDSGYTLHTRVEAMVDVNLEMSNIGALSMRRLMQHGSDANFQDVIGIDSAKHVSVRSKDTLGNHYSGLNEKQFKITGWYKQVDISIETDSDYYDSWVRNYAANDIKLYTRIVPKDGLMPAGKVINSTVNYNFKVTS